MKKRMYETPGVEAQDVDTFGTPQVEWQEKIDLLKLEESDEEQDEFLKTELELFNTKLIEITNKLKNLKEKEQTNQKQCEEKEIRYQSMIKILYDK